MPIIACRTAITCPGVDTPVTNYSSEAPDLFDFTSFSWVLWNPNQPLPPDISGRDTGDLPIYFSQGCTSICVSVTSQADADRCAANEAYLCGRGKQQDGEGAGPTLFFSRAQSCSATCADGSIVTLLVPAGYFVSTSQALSDSLASTYACQAANTSLVCLSNFTAGCSDQAYSSTSQITRGSGPITFALLGGALPPGLSLTQPTSTSIRLSGTPSSPGNYQFSIRARAANGVAVTKTYNVAILGISDAAALPDAPQSQAYTHQLTAAGGTAPYLFLLELGTLPAGLTLSPAGLISGTPTTIATETFVISISDSRTLFCTKAFTLKVTASMTCPVFQVQFGGPGADLWGANDPVIGRVITGSPQNLFDSNTLALIAPLAVHNPIWTCPWIPTNKEFAFSDGSGGLFTVDPNTGAIAIFGVGTDSDSALDYSADDDAIWCIGWDNGTGDRFLTKFNCATHTFVSSVNLGPGLFSRPSLCAYCPTPKVLLVDAITGGSTLDILSLPTGVVLHSINLNPFLFGAFNNGMLYNPVTKTFFATIVTDTPAETSQLIEIDPTLGIVINTYGLGENNPGGRSIRVTCNPTTGELYVMGISKLTAIDPIAKSIICQTAMPAGSYGAGYDKSSNSVFVGNFSTFVIRQYH